MCSKVLECISLYVQESLCEHETPCTNDDEIDIKLNISLIIYWFVVVLDKRVAMMEIRAVSGISGSPVPDNRLGHPNRNFTPGTQNVAFLERSNTHDNVF